MPHLQHFCELVVARRIVGAARGGDLLGRHIDEVLALSLRSTSPPMGREILEAFLAEPDGAENFDVRNVRLLDQVEREAKG